MVGAVAAAARMDGTEPLKVAEAFRMLTDDSFSPGPRPLLIGDGQPEHWIFKEEAGRKRRPAGKGDRWVHTAGKKGSRPLALKPGGPFVVRRRYGSVVLQGSNKPAFRYNSYKLLRPPCEGATELVEDKSSACLWHLMQSHAPRAPASVSIYPWRYVACLPACLPALQGAQRHK
jgi:hypothetical protein|eukprot:COSAG01_NODE_841_length_13175_cov_26.426124_13_plen_174_part_00